MLFFYFSHWILKVLPKLAWSQKNCNDFLILIAIAVSESILEIRLFQL